MLYKNRIPAVDARVNQDAPNGRLPGYKHGLYASRPEGRHAGEGREARQAPTFILGAANGAHKLAARGLSLRIAEGVTLEATATT